ncbi:site-specific integrase [Micromonospora sp. NPDC005171]|uniref:site-specific integrase n=1 Tax=Micromonospora sp. NPDC005171 TaxID=3156866 RepID=UPI0033A8E3EB
MITAVTSPVWRVLFRRAELIVPPSPIHGMAEVCAGWPAWLAESGLEPGTPFLVSPSLEYDVALNGFFLDPAMRAAAVTTQAGYARDLAAFLSFLWSARGKRSWRDATESDHVAYLVWRRRDPDGPRVAGATWDREVAAVNRFYRWAVRRGHVASNPVPQVSRRPAGFGAGRAGARTLDEQRPATYSHDVVRERVPGPARPTVSGQPSMSPDASHQGGQEGPWSACRDVSSHPATGRACRSSFLDCFHCGNCLIDSSHLPRLLALLIALEQRRQQMTEEQWWAKYGPAWAAIRSDVLPRFTPAEVARARLAQVTDALLDLVDEPWEHP